VTLQTIADEVGVSRMTVSNAFSKPDQLSAPLRERILAAAQSLGYVGPDPAARALAKGTTGAVGVVFTHSLRFAFTDLVATGFLGAIAEELAPTGLSLTLLTSSDEGDIVPARDVAMDGALVYSCDWTSHAVDILRRRRLPLVYVDQDPVDDIPSVNVDDRGGARAAARHLLDLGHRRIGLLLSGTYGPYGLLDAGADPGQLLDPPGADLGHASRQRLLGWLDELGPAGVEPILVRQDGTGLEAARWGARLLLDRPDRPTAVLCFSDAVAYGALQAAAELGIDVPGQLSVVGFDDSQLIAFADPPLTTVRQPVEDMAAEMARLLVERVERPDRPVSSVVFAPTLVVRRSS
jgi:DNA-binding LacI/PurR family transcriptional regulator